MRYCEHRVNCLHCGKLYTCGDCVTFTCRECESKGHHGWSIDCPICSREAAERRARIDAAIALRRDLALDPEPESLDERDPTKRQTA